MNLAWAAAGALAGLPAGALLRGPVFRMSVASGEPGRTACPRCGAVLAGRGLAGLLAARCRGCGGRFTAPLVLELSTAAVLALLCGRFAGQPSVLAFGFLGALG